MPQKKFIFIFAFLIFLAFIFFSYLVAKETFTQFDFDTTVKFQDRISPRWDLPFSTLSVFGQAEVIGIIWLGLVIYFAIKRYWLTFFSMALLPIALAIELYGKMFLYHPAPPFLFYRGVIHIDFPTHFVHTNYSYPSGHMLRTAFLLTFFSLFFFLKLPKKWQIFLQPPLIILFVAMIVSRIYLGEHWTSDVIGGALLGVSFGMLAASTLPIAVSKKTG